MTTDPFTEAARAEAEALVDDIVRWDDTIATDGPCDGTWDSLAEYLAGRGWARTHLTAQEPTDAEVEAAARAISAEQDRRIGLKAGAWWGGAEYRRNFAREDARAALSAARAARRDEEKRDG